MTVRDELLAGIGSRIAFWRKDVRGLTLRQLGEITGIDHSNLSKLESGSAALSLTRLNRVAIALKIPLAVLVDPSLEHVAVQGRLTGAGGWTQSPGPLFAHADVYPFVLPRMIAGATVAFENGKGGILICTPIDGEPVPGDRYVILRRIAAGELGYSAVDQNDAPLEPKAAADLLATEFFELAARTFKVDADAGDDADPSLERAVVAGVPADPGKPRRQNPLEKALRQSRRLGWFEASGGPMEDRYAARLDTKIINIWRILGWLQINV